MNEDFIKNREIGYSLEYVQSEMELKMWQYKQANPEADISEMQSKIARVNKAKEYIYDSFDELEDFKRKMQLLELTNSKLLAQLNANDKAKL